MDSNITNHKMVSGSKYSLKDLQVLLWIIFLICLLTKGGTGIRSLDEKELAKMKHQWEECCRSNDTFCHKSSCYSVEWRAATWAGVRNRCRGRYSDWPFAVDIMRVQEEKDIEALWTLLSRRNPYPNQNAGLPVTVWTSGTQCPVRRPSGIVVSTKWASNETFPSWLQERVKTFSSSNASNSDEGCKFMVITPQSDRTASFDFEDENAKHVAVCEFLFPDNTGRTTAESTTTITTLSYDDTEVSTEATSSSDEDISSTTVLSSTTDLTRDLSVHDTTAVQSETSYISTTWQDGSTEGTNGVTTTSDDQESGTSTVSTDVTLSDTTTAQSDQSETSYATTSRNVSVEDRSWRTTTLNGSESETSTVPTDVTSDVGVSDTTTIQLETSNIVTHGEDSQSRATTDVNLPGCKGRSASGIQWPSTPPGATANQSCPEGMTGYAQWKCDEKTMTFVPEKPSIHNCRHTWIDKLEEEIHADGDAVKITSELANKTKEKILSHGDIAAVVELAENLMELFRTQKYEKEANEELLHESDMTFNFTKSFVATYSNVLRSEHSEAWGDLPQVHQRRVASKILRHTETVGQFLSCIKKTEDNVQYIVLEDNINLRTYAFNPAENRSLPYVFPKLDVRDSSSGQIKLPAEMTLDLWPSSCPKLKTAVGIVYKNVGQFLKDESDNDTDSSVNSPVLGFTLGNSTTGTVKLPRGIKVSILLRHTIPLDKKSAAYKTPRCVFWNFLRGAYGDWDHSGCQVDRSNFTHTTCSCDHLTNFAILMDVNNNVGGKDLTLETMTYVCCGLSSIALVFTIICLIAVRAMHCRRSTITCNLCFCLLVMNVIVIFGVDQTANKLLCAITAGFLQYAVIAAFCWMLLEAHHLYQKVVVVLCSSNEISKRYIYLFGYGLPLTIVGVSAGIRPEDYGTADFCWLSNENGLMWSTVGPACFIFLVNLIVFIMTMKSASSIKCKKEQKTSEQLKKWVRGSLSILCLLGITWFVGLFYMEKSFYPAAYAFILLNGSQGVSIFIFHVLMNDKTESFFRRIFKREIVRQTTKSTFLHGTSSSEHRRGHVRNGMNDGRNTRSLSQQISGPNSASSIVSIGVPPKTAEPRRNSYFTSKPTAVQSMSYSEEPRRNSYFMSRPSPATKVSYANGVRKKSLSRSVSSDVPHTRPRLAVTKLQEDRY